MKNPFTRKPKTAKSKTTKTTSRKLSFRKPSLRAPGLGLGLALLFVASAGLLGGSGYYWYKNVLTDPDRIISDMLDKSLQTSSMQRSISQKSGVNTLDQTIYTSFSPETVASSKTDLREVSQLGITKVTTETIGNSDSDYVRYTDINIEGRGSERNFDEVINVWGMRESGDQPGQQTSFLNDAIFLVVPFGNLDENERRLLKEEIRETELYSYESSKLEYINNRPVMKYQIEMEPEKLVTVLAKYAELSGLGENAQLDPAAYAGASALPIELQVDVLSRHVKSINYGSTERVENYQGYNFFRKVEVPSETIDVNELQRRLQTLAG